jgi:hypothetical protein
MLIVCDNDMGIYTAVTDLEVLKQTHTSPHTLMCSPSVHSEDAIVKIEDAHTVNTHTETHTEVVRA